MSRPPTAHQVRHACFLLRWGSSQIVQRTRARRLLVGSVDEAMAGMVGPERRKLRTQLGRLVRVFLVPVVVING